MVCHRWTVALILICVPILATVISAFRVRLPGSSPEVKPDLRKHKCENCDVSDLNLDPVLDSSKKKSAKSPYDDVKNILKEKRHLISEKLNKASYEISESEDFDENEDKATVEKRDPKHTANLKSDRESKTRIKKPSIVLDFSDDGDSDMDDDDDEDEKSKVKNLGEIDLKKKVDVLPRVTIKIEKPKAKEKVDIEIDESTHKKELSKIKIVSKEKLDKIPEKRKVESFKEEKLKTLAHATKDDEKFSDDHLKVIKDTLKELVKTKTEVKEKKKDIVAKEAKSVSHKEEDSLNLKDKIKEAERSKTKKEIKEEPVKKKEEVMEKVIKEKKTEKLTKTIPDSRERLSEDLEKYETSKEVTNGKKIETKSDSKEVHIFSDALHRKNLLLSEFEDFYSFFPTFAPNFSRINNPECRRHGQILLRQLRGRKLWALSMLDATAKIPSGFLQGNGIQLGDFDQCLGVRARVQLDTGSVVRLQGKYCLAMIDIKAEHPELEIPVHLAQARNLLKSRVDDPGHFVPRFSTLSWGVCVPSPCTSEDVEVVLRDAVKHYQYKTGITTRIRVNEHDCFTRKGANWWMEWLETPTILTLSFYALIIILVLIATLQDYAARNSSDDDQNEKINDKEEKEGDNNKPSDGFLSSFSLYNTLSKLVAPASSDDIACIHGVRAIATLALLIAHKFLPIALTPYTNRIRLSEIVISPLLSWCRAGWIFTDCFLMISGTLTSYRKSTNDNVLSKLLSRYFRLTPALLAIVLFYAYVWDNISIGPMWGTLVWKNAQLCREGWWWNILYVQNYFGFEDMCAGQTHHMALDFQLTVLGSILVWMIQSEVPFAGMVVPILHLLSAYSRYMTVKNHRLTLLVYQGVSVSQLYRTGRLSYMSISHRLSPYLIGLTLGLLLRNRSRPTKLLAFLGWFVCGTLWGLVYWAGYDAGYPDYHYDVTYAAQYAMLAPLAAASSSAWLIYAVQNGYSGILSRVLCSRPLLFISRISYALYLVQFVIYLTSTATTKTSKEFTLISLIDLQEISTILLSSIILTVTLVLPLQALPKLFETKNIGNSEDDLDSNIKDEKEMNFKTNIEERSREAPPRRSLLAHREVLEEIPEVEVEYETQREPNEGLEEILEEEEEDMQDREEEEDLEVIEEEQGGEEDFWEEREQYSRSHSRNDNQDVDEWEWTAHGNDKSGNQHYRSSR